MAYGTKYTANWAAQNKTGVLIIEQKDYVGASSTLVLHNDAIKITAGIESWEEHIFGSICEFDIVNNGTDYFSLIDLMVATERKYRITVNCTIGGTTYVLFTGFINTEAVTQRYIQYATIHLVASSFTSKLEFIFPESLYSKNDVTFIDIISEILAQAGNTFPIRVCSFLRSSLNSSYVAGKSFMNQNGVNNEIFWENNIDKVSSFDILNGILKGTECYLYYWDSCWYIESFDVLFNDSKYYAQYASGSFYTPVDAGTEVVVTDITPKDVHDLVFMNTQQTLTVNPGNRTVQVRINQKSYYNLTVNDFSNIVRVGDPVLTPPVREWRAYQPMGQTSMVWNAQGKPYKTMINAIRRTSDFVNVPNHENYDDYPYKTKGLYTTFICSNDGIANLSIKWKYTYGYSQTSKDFYTVFRWELQVITLAGIFVGSIFWDEDVSQWRLGSQGTNSLTYIEAAEFDTYTYIADVNINIPLSEVQDLVIGDYKMVLAIKMESNNVRGKNTNFIEKDVYYGDVQISASIDTYDENVIEGVTVTDFIKKTTIEVDISDVPNRNYKNGVLQGDTLTTLTSLWTRNEATQRKLADFILIDKFRMGSVSRQIITSPVKSTELLRPFAQFTEKKQAYKKFLLTSYVFDVTKDEYDVTLSEYDNTTEINLTEE